MKSDDQLRGDSLSKGAANHSAPGGSSLPARPAFPGSTHSENATHQLKQEPVSKPVNSAPVTQFALTDYLPSRRTVFGAQAGALGGLATAGVAAVATGAAVASAPFIAAGAAAGAVAGSLWNRFSRPAAAVPAAPQEMDAKRSDAAAVAPLEADAKLPAAAGPASAVVPPAPAGAGPGKLKVTPEQNTARQREESKKKREEDRLKRAGDAKERDAKEAENAQERQEEADKKEADRKATWVTERANFYAVVGPGRRAAETAAADAATEAATDLAYWTTRWDALLVQHAAHFNDDFRRNSPKGVGVANQLLAAFAQELRVIQEQQRIARELPGEQVKWDAILAAPAGQNQSVSFRSLIEKRFIEFGAVRWYRLLDQSEYGLSMAINPRNGLVSAEHTVVHLHCDRLTGNVKHASVKYGAGAQNERERGTGVVVTGASAAIWPTDRTYNDMVATYGPAQ